MTEKETIEYIIETRKFLRTFDDYANYISLVVPMGFVAIGFLLVYNYFKFHSGWPMLILSILFISVGVWVAFFVLNRLNDNITFTGISPIADDNLEHVAEKLKQNLRIRSVDINKDLKRIVAFTKMTAFSWGEQLTLVVDKDCILVNSKPSGSR